MEKENKNLKKITPEDLKNILWGHLQWIQGNNGVRADLSNTDLSQNKLNGVNLSRAVLSGANFYGTDLSDADLSGADLSRTNMCEVVLIGANLSGANLYDSNLTRAEAFEANFNDADLSGAELSRINLQNATLLNANFAAAKIKNADLAGVKLTGANLTAAIMSKSNFSSADMTEAKLVKAVMEDADLSDTILVGANLAEANLTKANLCGADMKDANTYRVKYDYHSMRCRGIKVEGSYGSQRFRRDAMDADFVEELRTSSFGGKIAYWIWMISCDCGRSLTRWVMLTTFMLILFGYIYWSMGDEFFKLPTGQNMNFGTCLYFSAITMSTVGYGDITPNIGPASLTVVIQVMTGYFMLGVLISIGTTKISRRS